jgi:peptidoglycan/LPS O-acetylase OafA/YrhL
MLKQPGRLTELDAMRGIAAVSVVLSHAVDSLRVQGALPPFVGALDATPLRAMFNGHIAVIFFFVLSGLVLTRGLILARSPGIIIFAIRRVVRLCVPAAAVLLFSAALYALFARESALFSPDDWMVTAGWTRIPSPIEVIRQALLIGADGDFYLDAVLWSLAQELRLSVFLPIIVYVVMRWDRNGGTMPLLAAFWDWKSAGMCSVAHALPKTLEANCFFRSSICSCRSGFPSGRRES